MRVPTQLRLMVGALLALGLASCTGEPAAQRLPRPVAGDTVTPVIVLGHPWQQKGLVLISARLQTKSKGETEAQTLQLEDVPYDSVPRVTLAYFVGEQPLGVEEVELKRDC